MCGRTEKNACSNPVSFTLMSVVFCFFACTCIFWISSFFSVPIYLEGKCVNEFKWLCLFKHEPTWFLWHTQIISTNHKNATINELFSTSHEFLDYKEKKNSPACSMEFHLTHKPNGKQNRWMRFFWLHGKYQTIEIARSVVAFFVIPHRRGCTHYTI